MRNPFAIGKAAAYSTVVGLLLNLVPTSTEAGEWESSLTPYLWMAGLEGQVGAFAGLPPAEVDASFKDDLLGNINVAFMIAAEARKDRLGLIMDLAYVDVEADAETRGVVYESASLQSKLWLFSMAAAYRLEENDRGFLDLVGGVKYISWENILSVGNQRVTRSASGKDDWYDPIIGFRGMYFLGNSAWFVRGSFIGGGFGVSSDSLWDLYVSLGYQWSDSFSTTLGYRYFDVSYEDDGFMVDMAFDGALVGLRWNW